MSDEEVRLVNAIRESPEFFFEHVLGETLDEQQRELLRAFKTSRRISVKSGHSCGKDWTAGRLALWYHVAYFPSLVVTTGPTDRQVKEITWGEIRSAYYRSRYPIGGELLPGACKLKSGDPKHFMIGYTANDPAAFQGFHSDNVLVIVTEAQGIDPAMWPGIESLMSAPNAKLLLIGNATYEPGSEFYLTHTSKAHLYDRITFDSEKSSHCSKQWVEEMRSVFGEDSPMFLARVKGIFPTDISDSLIPLGWIERAQNRWGDPAHVAAHAGGVLSIGADIARFGSDFTTFYRGEGDRFSCVHEKQGQDLMETAGQLAGIIKRGVPAAHVRIDDTGLGGGVTDRLREQQHRVTAINFGAKAKDEEHYANVRAQGYFNLRERFRLGTIAIDPRDVKLARDLSVIKMKQLSNGAIKIEDKAEQKRKLGYSPDRADALMLAALPQGLALDLECGAIPSRGLLEFVEMMARKAASNPAQQAVSSRPAAEIPGAGGIPMAGDASDRAGLFR